MFFKICLFSLLNCIGDSAIGNDASRVVISATQHGARKIAPTASPGTKVSTTIQGIAQSYHEFYKNYGLLLTLE